MNILKKILSVFLCTVLLFAAVSDCLYINPKASVSGDFEYSLYYNEWIMITGYRGDAKTVVIPERISGKPVRGIGKSSFKGSDIEEIIFPSSLKCIYAEAFNDCEHLEKIEFNNGLKTIYNSFQHTGLKCVTLPKSLKTVGGSAFSGCNMLKEIVFDGTYFKQLNVSSVYIDGFGCKNAEIIFNCTPSVEIDLLFTNSDYCLTENDGKYIYKYNDTPESPTRTNGNYLYSVENNEAVIKKYLDYDAQNIVVPNELDGYTVTRIDDYAFCSYESVGELWDDVEQTFDEYTFESIMLPDTISTIGKYAFAFNNNLKSISLPDTIMKVGYCAFAECQSLKSVDIPGSMSIITDYIFAGCSLENITLHDGLKAICQNAFNLSNFDNSEIALPDSLEYIGENAFCDNSFSSVSLPENIKELDSSFCNSRQLESVIFNDEIEIINGAFEGCSRLRSVEIPESTTVLGDNSFSECTSLEHVYISSNINSIGENAFYDCSSVKEFVWDSPVKNIESNAFHGCSVSEFDFSSTDYVAENAFRESGITKVRIGDIPENADYKQEIGSYSFYGCEKLTVVSLGRNINEIPSKAFANCPNLEMVAIADSVENISADAFENSENIIIVCNENSYAYNYATENNINVTTMKIAPIPNQKYTGKQIKPSLDVTVSSEKLTYFIDYSVSYSDNINVGTAKGIVSGKGDFSMLMSKIEFAIIARNINEVNVKRIPTQEYNGAECKPDVHLSYNGRALIKSEDYTVTYSNNLNEMKGTATIKGIGNYYGTIVETYKIKIVEDEPLINIILKAIKSFIKEIYLKIINLFR